MKFKIGTRVRVVQVDPEDAPVLGRPAVIVSIHEVPIRPFVLYGLDIAPFYEDEEAWYGFRPSQLEPSLNQHEPAEQDFLESLDHLLSRLKGVEA